MANQMVSLAYYVSRAKRDGATIEQLSVAPYLETLPHAMDLPRAIVLWNEMYGPDDTLVSLSEIDIPQVDYLDIVVQIFHGVRFDDVRLTPEVPPAHPAHASYFAKYLVTIPNDMRTAPAVTASLDRVEDILASRGGASSRANGLIVGRVQSGKTRNYIGLMLKAVDEGWNVILVLTSSNTFLAKQTRDRIVHEFAGVGADNPRLSCELKFLSSTSNRPAGAELNEDFFYWGVSMKEVEGLGRIKKWLDLPNQPYRAMRVLIVDDESDNATPDSNAGGQGLLDDEAIAERIDGIRHDAHYAELAAWFEDLLDRDWPEIGANTHEANVFGEICDILAGTMSSRVKMDRLINGGAFRQMLGMERFADPPVESLIPAFFNRTHGEDAPSGFVLLLRSILTIARGRSAINANLCTLVGPNPQTGEYAYPFGRCCYLGYTATPYANILNEGPGHTPIYADFIQSLDISPQYFGAEAIFGTDISDPVPRMPIVHAIVPDESAKILAPLRDSTLQLDDDLNGVSTFGTQEWRGLKEAIAWAFCTAAARRCRMSGMPEAVRRKIENRWTTMLVNVDHKQPVHASVQAAIRRYLDRRLATPDSRRTFCDECVDLWEREIKLFTAERFSQLFNSGAEGTDSYGTFVHYPSSIEIGCEISHYFLENATRCVHVVVMNCTAEGGEAKRLYNQDPDEIARGEVMELTDSHLWIVSGGNTISRGLTLLGLTTSYFDRLRDGTCVDTVTQMGRWFGYRTGYELLPRLWMNATTVGEMKRIAVLEKKLHAAIADNFAQHFSPADPAHYQQISSWGRQLSGRAFATRNLDAVVGTIAATGEFYRAAEKRRQIADAGHAFLDLCGVPVVRDPRSYQYHGFPLWESVPREDIRRFLERVLPLYPDKSRRLLRGLLREMSANDNAAWDVVIGSARSPGEYLTSDALGPRVNCATPRARPVDADRIQFSARHQMAFYAMIPTVYLNRADVELVAKWRLRIFDAIDAKRIQNGGVLPTPYERDLPGGPEETLQTRLDRTIDELRAADGAKPIPETLRARLGDIAKGFINRSSAEYMAGVHRAANHGRPTLQLLLVRPEGEPIDGVPYVSISFYWPDHDPTGFFTVAVDENPDFVTMVTRRGFCQTVEDILRRHDFPMQRRELLREVLECLGPRCNESFFSANIAHPLAGYAYHAMDGRNAYCIDGWAADEEQRLGREFAAVAIAVLQRELRPMASQEVLDRAVEEQPKFRDFFTRHADLDALLTDEILNANDIAVTSRRPITYAYRV